VEEVVVMVFAITAVITAANGKLNGVPVKGDNYCQLVDDKD
jgi:hypothetical protein